jgi:hypothetical protein
LPKSERDIQLKKRGRKSGEELTRQVGLALKHLQELEWLEESPLARLPEVLNLAEGTYRDSALPAGFALSSLLIYAAKIVLRDLGDLPGYQREIMFLKAYLKCQSVVEISRSLGLCREHVARSIQPRAIGLVARVFFAKANDGCSTAITDAATLHQRD